MTDATTQINPRYRRLKVSFMTDKDIDEIRDLLGNLHLGVFHPENEEILVKIEQKLKEIQKKENEERINTRLQFIAGLNKLNKLRKIMGKE